MAYELREGQGTLFRNDRKEKDTHPDYTGSIKLPDGSEHWFSAWLKQSNSGTKFMSVQIGNPKKDGQQQQRRPPAGANPPMGNAPVAPRRGSIKDDLSDDIPFNCEWR